MSTFLKQRRLRAADRECERYDFGGQTVQELGPWSSDETGDPFYRSVRFSGEETELSGRDATGIISVHFQPRSAQVMQILAAKDDSPIGIADVDIAGVDLSLTARFQPQHWQGDVGVDAGVPTTFDAAPALFGLEPSRFRHVCGQILTSDWDLTVLAERSDLVGTDPGQHNGPFTVFVESDDFKTLLDQLDIGPHASIVDLDDSDIEDLKYEFKQRTILPISDQPGHQEPEAESGETEPTDYASTIGAVLQDYEELVTALGNNTSVVTLQQIRRLERAKRLHAQIIAGAN